MLLRLQAINKDKVHESWHTLTTDADSRGAPMIQLRLPGLSAVVLVDPRAIHAITKRPQWVPRYRKLYRSLHWLVCSCSPLQPCGTQRSNALQSQCHSVRIAATTSWALPRQLLVTALSRSGKAPTNRDCSMESLANTALDARSRTEILFMSAILTTAVDFASVSSGRHCCRAGAPTAWWKHCTSPSTPTCAKRCCRSSAAIMSDLLRSSWPRR